jgi:hypothetical protein
MRVLRVTAIAVIAAALLAGCRVDARVQITLAADGSGSIATTLTLDREAVERMGGAEELATSIPLDDLKQAGWKIDAWTAAKDGGYTTKLTRSFRDEADLNRRLVDLAGPDGALRDANITHSRRGFSSKNGVSVTVDGSDPAPGIVADSALATQLKNFGIDPAAMETQLAKELRDNMHLTVAVTLPDGTHKVVSANPDNPQTLAASHSEPNWDHITQFGIALLLALLAVMFFSAATVSARRNRRRQAARVRYDEVERAPLM